MRLTTAFNSSLFGSRSDLQDGHVLQSSSLLIVVCLTFLIIFTVFGNAATILAVLKMKSVNNSVSNLYIASLAGADILVGMFAMTFMMLYRIVDEGHWKYGPKMCDSWLLIDVISSTVSLYSVCAIGLDRWLNLEKPLRFFKRNKSIARHVIVAAWILPVIIWVPLYFTVKSRNQALFDNRGESCYFTWEPKHLIIAFAIPFLYLPVLLLLVIFVRISMVIHAHLIFLEKHSNHDSTKGSTRDLNGDKPGSRPGSRPVSRIATSVSNRRLDVCGSNGALHQKCLEVSTSGALTPHLIQQQPQQQQQQQQQQQPSPVALQSDVKFFVQDDNGRLSAARRLASPRKFEKELWDFQAIPPTSRSPSRYSTLTTNTLTANGSGPRSPMMSRKSSGSGVSCQQNVQQNKASQQPTTTDQVADESSPLTKYPGAGGRRATATGEDAVSKRKRFSKKTPQQLSLNVPLITGGRDRENPHGSERQPRSIDRQCLPPRQLTIDRQLSVSRDSIQSVSNQSNSSHEVGGLDWMADLKRSSVTSDTAVVFTHRLLRRKQIQQLNRTNTETIIEVSTNGFSGLFSTSTVHRLSISSQLFNKRYSLNIFSDLLPCGTAISQQIRAAKAVGVMTICFLLCWLPFLVVWPLKIYCDECVSDSVYNIAIWANYFNSSLNPILYALCSPRFQVVFRELYARYSQRCLRGSDSL